MKLFIALTILVFSFSARAKLEPETLKSYNKAQILLSRFGNEQLQALRTQVLNLRPAINRSVVGQDDLAAAIQTRLDQYLNSLGSRDGEPVALHMIGLTGIGKTSIIKVLETLGFPIYKIVAEHYPGGENASGSEWRLMEALEKAASLQKSSNQPLILFIDEIDKTPEITPEKEVAQPVISSLNEILSEGQLTGNRGSTRTLKFHNIFIMTAMNFAPSQIDAFASEIVKDKSKSYWQFNEDDMKKFDEWVRSGDQAESSVARLLEQLYRSNTVGRMSADTVVAKALFKEDFDKIVDININEVVRRLTRNPKAGLRITWTPAYRDFLRKYTTFAPSGARMSVKRIDLLTEQLVSIASRADTGDAKTLMLPRDIQLDFDSGTGEAVVNIKALNKNGNKVQLVANREFRSKYNRAAGSFVIPDGVLKPLPASLARTNSEFAEEQATPKVTSKDIREIRMSLRHDYGIAAYLKTVIHDQDEMIDDIATELNDYMNSEEEAIRFLSITGFQGVGKTSAIREAAEFLDIPIVKMNMQEYSGDSQEAADRFGEDLAHRISKAREESETGKYVVQIEELDKVYEVNPQDGKLVNRPVMSYIKDLLSDGVRKVTIKNAHSYDVKILDIRDAQLFITSNFGYDRFHLTADPRLTTIDDMQHLHEEIKASPSAIHSLYNSMYLPETTNRLLAHTTVPRPLTKSGYEKLIDDQVTEVLRVLSSGEDSEVNTGALKIKLSRSYKQDYLFAESVIPSEGGRQAQEAARSLLLNDVMDAINSLPADSPLIRRPVEILLDYKAKSAKHDPQVTAYARLSDKEDREKNGGDHKTKLYTENRQLRFPPPIEFRGLSPRRTLVAAHEFGHALVALMFGGRFEMAIAELPDGGGVVKTRKLLLETGRTVLADVLSTVGSRAMERIIMSENPQKKSSVLEITKGSIIDIGQVTAMMWEIVYQLGMDPQGGVIERSGLKGDERDDYLHRNYHFEGLSDEKIAEMGLVVRDMEDFLVDQLLKLHDREWYREHITQFARAGQLTEEQFYALIGHEFPGENRYFVGEASLLERDYAKDIAAIPASVTKARKFKMANGLTAAENLENAVSAFKISMANRLHKSEKCEDIVAGGKKKKSKKNGAQG